MTWKKNSENEKTKARKGDGNKDLCLGEDTRGREDTEEIKIWTASQARVMNCELVLKKAYATLIPFIYNTGANLFGRCHK